MKNSYKHHKPQRGPVYEGVTAKRGLGQHFLKDEDIAIEIVDSLLIPENDLKGAKTEPHSVPVIEIGPGTGVLTKFLLMDERIKLELCEIDPEAIEKLRGRFNQFLYTLVPRDFLKTDINDIFPLQRQHESEVYIIGNFPYNISSQIFFKILENRDRVTQVVCMLQKEVAERLAAPPGGKEYGILSVLLQAWYDIEYLFTANEDVFVPQPKVKSGVIRLWRNERKELGCDEALFKSIIKTCFNQRRKTIHNSIKPLVSGLCARLSRTPEELLSKISPDYLNARPERLGVEDFITICKAMS